jgi:hypothetical protein
VNSIVHFDKANSWKGVCFSPSFYSGKRFNLSENALDTALIECESNLGLQKLSQKGRQANAPAFLALTIQALIRRNCFAPYLLRQPLRAGEG